MQPNNTLNTIEIRNNQINFFQEGALSFGRTVNNQLKTSTKFDKFIFNANKIALVSYDAFSTISAFVFNTIEFKQNEILGFRRQREVYPIGNLTDAKAYQIQQNKFVCSLRSCLQYVKLFGLQKQKNETTSYTSLYRKMVEDSTCLSPISFVGKRFADLKIQNSENCMAQFKNSQAIKTGGISTKESDLYENMQLVFQLPK